MDFTGTRRDGSDEESVEQLFYRQVGEELWARVHPVDFQGPRGTTAAPRRHEIVRNWRLAGYRLATELLPTERVRVPDELDAFKEGLLQRLREYELEHLGASESGIEVVEELDVEGCDKIESKAQKYLRLATHATTPSSEAASAALHIARMIVNGDLALLSLERVRHLAQRLTRMEEAFRTIRQENPLQFLYGTREQRQTGE
jgi:hypothetical protein